MKTFIQVMKALSDPSRTRIIKLLQNNDLCVCEITKRIGLSQPSVSKHLKQLETAGLVASRRAGQAVIYRISESPENQYATTLLGHLTHWLENGNGARHGERPPPGRAAHDDDHVETGHDRVRA